MGRDKLSLICQACGVKWNESVQDMSRDKLLETFRETSCPSCGSEDWQSSYTVTL